MMDVCIHTVAVHAVKNDRFPIRNPVFSHDLIVAAVQLTLTMWSPKCEQPIV